MIIPEEKNVGKHLQRDLGDDSPAKHALGTYGQLDDDEFVSVPVVGGKGEIVWA